MSIYIMRDGQKAGPFSEEAARVLLEQGEVEEGDLACREGDPSWEPLSEVLQNAAAGTSPSAQDEEERPAEPEPATAAQIAFLTYFNVSTPVGLSKEAAERLIAKTSEDRKNAKRLTSWKSDRLKLHPELFAAEIRAMKEDRAQFFFDLCQTAGADYFTGVTKAHCQVLVAFLDVKFPRWDANHADAMERYFFPAIAEKFPQLVNKAWRGKLHYGHGPSTSKSGSKSPTSKLGKKPDTALAAMARGVVLGMCILAVLYAADRLVQIKGGALGRPKISLPLGGER